LIKKQVKDSVHKLNQLNITVMFQIQSKPNKMQNTSPFFF